MYIQPEIAADTVFPPDITEHIIPAVQCAAK